MHCLQSWLFQDMLVYLVLNPLCVLVFKINSGFDIKYQGVQLNKGRQGYRGITVRYQQHGRMGQQMVAAIQHLKM